MGHRLNWMNTTKRWLLHPRIQALTLHLTYLDILALPYYEQIMPTWPVHPRTQAQLHPACVTPPLQRPPAGQQLSPGRRAWTCLARNIQDGTMAPPTIRGSREISK
jgi:hypothetical protein